MQYAECDQCAKWSPRLAIVGNITVSLFKFLVGIITGSKGLVADSVHSVADSISSLFILIALKISDKPKDSNHPFGHGKVEYISSLLASLFIFICAASIFLDAMHSFKTGMHEVPHTGAIFATILCLFYSNLMYRSNKCAGTQMNSPALLADAAESKADMLASVAVLLGLIGTKVGFVYADTVAAVVISFLVFHISVEMFFGGVNGLIDKSLKRNVLEDIRDLCLDIKGVEGVRSMKSRCMGKKSNLDIELDIEKTRTVLEAHKMTEQIKSLIIERVAGIDSVFIKMHPVKKWKVLN